MNLAFKERSKKIGDLWQKMGEEDKAEWREKYLAEKEQYKKYKKQIDEDGDFSRIPKDWLKEKKKKKEEKRKGLPSKKKKKSPKKRMESSSSESSSDDSSSSDSDFGGVASNGTSSSSSSSSSSDSEEDMKRKKKVSQKKKKRKKRRVPKKIKKKKVIKKPTVPTRRASKLAGKSGSMSKQTVARKVNVDLSKKEQLALLQSQPQDAISDEDDSSLSSMDGMRGGMIPRTPDKDKEMTFGKSKKKEELPATLPDESSDEDDHFGV